MKIFSVILSLFFAISLQGCHYAKSNQQVVISNDCGNTWKKINSGESVPKGTLDPCYMKVVIPNFPMPGENTFICNLSEKVRATVHIDYEYSIIEPLSFIKQARYLGKANTHADDEEALNNDAFETAENIIIDTRLRDVAKAIFIKEDIVEIDQAEIELKLLQETNKRLDELGILLNFITLTFELDELTRQAVDVSTALKIYQSKDIEELGKEIILRKSGASKIIINNNQEPENTN